MLDSKLTTLFLAVLLGSALAIGGCAGEDENGEDTQTDPCDLLPCPDGFECEVQNGLPTCVAVDETPDPVEPDCDAENPCTDPTEECRDGECVPKCQGVQCGADEECEPTTGDCVPVDPGTPDPECTTDDDCPGDDQICVDGECGGGSFAHCTSDPEACANGYDCLGPFGDNSHRCLMACQASTTCPTIMYSCENIASSGPAMMYCVENVCSEGGETENFFQPCDAAGTADGTCVPWPTNADPIGLCFAGGSAGEFAACEFMGPYGQPTLTCAQGHFCLPTDQGDLCVQLCDLDPASEPNCTGGATCEALFESGAPTGFCMPQQ